VIYLVESLVKHGIFVDANAFSIHYSTQYILHDLDRAHYFHNTSVFFNLISLSKALSSLDVLLRLMEEHVR
jgi:hypothetical protein